MIPQLIWLLKGEEFFHAAVSDRYPMQIILLYSSCKRRKVNNIIFMGKKVGSQEAEAESRKLVIGHLSFGRTGSCFPVTTSDMTSDVHP
jgi:hypothetical protein